MSKNSKTGCGRSLHQPSCAPIGSPACPLASVYRLPHCSTDSPDIRKKTAKIARKFMIPRILDI